MCCIRNIKISVKCELFSLDNVIKRLHESKITFKYHFNFITLSNKFNYTIFKSGKESNHINITKIKDFKDIDNAINELNTIYHFNILSIKIDNIIATGVLKKTIDLQTIIDEKKFKQVNYNSEVFPGLFIKFKIGTAIIFHTGKFVVVGCKDKDSIKCIIQSISVNI
jgi:TATA-box binding protein (TBP) (component of TFIID and TFIIIB)